MRHFTLLLVLFTVQAASHAQTYLMGTPLIESCTGTLHDSGGPASSYPFNETSSTVVCSGVAGMRTVLTFGQFALTDPPLNQVPNDRLIIYDGDSPTAPLIGSYILNQLQGATISAGPGNASGCLYLRFLSNDQGSGNFTATISCEAACTPPMASFTSIGDTAVLCPGAAVVMDASPSEVPGGVGGSIWWANGQQVPSVGAWPLDTIALPLGTLFEVRLQVTDDAGCASALSDPAWVLFSPEADFSGTPSPAPTCPLDTVFLEGQATMPPWLLERRPGSDYGSGAPVPDDVGRPFDFFAIVEGHPEGAVVEDPEDLGQICIIMEHSHSGDLVIDLICPNGQGVTLHQMNTGSTKLGDAYDPLPNEQPGTCWTYCFSSTPTYGTWVEHRVSGPDPNVVDVTYGQALIPGTYTPVDDLDQLVGCPINGIWTLEVLDLWAADNGFICSWELGFEPQVDVSYVDRTPHLGLYHPDSVGWSGSNLWPGATPNRANAFLLGPSEQPFTFQVLDDLGCSHDTTLVVVPLPRPNVEAGPGLVTCSGDDAMEAMVSWPQGDSCAFRIVMWAEGGGGWRGAHLQVSVDGQSLGIFQPPFPGWGDTLDLFVAHGAQVTLYYTAASVPVWNQFNSFTLFDGEGQVLYTSPFDPPTGLAFEGTLTCTGAGVPLSLQWSPAAGLVDPGDPVTGLLPGASGWYTLTATNTGQCAASDSVFVESSFQSTSLSFNSTLEQLCTDLVAGATYQWRLNGEVQLETTTPCIEVPGFGNWSVLVVMDTGCDLLSGELPVCPAFVVEQVGSELQATPGLGRYIWTMGGDTLQDGPSSDLFIQGDGLYQVEVVMEVGCVMVAQIEVIGTGLPMVGFARDLRVIPNPNRGAFRLQVEAFDGNRSMVVRDLSGRVVLQRNLLLQDGRSNEVVLDLAAGNYILELVAPAGRARATLMVE